MKSCDKMESETNMTTILLGKIRFTRDKNSLRQWSSRLPTETLWKGVSKLGYLWVLEDEVIWRMALAFSAFPDWAD